MVVDLFEGPVRGQVTVVGRNGPVEKVDRRCSAEGVIPDGRVWSSLSDSVEYATGGVEKIDVSRLGSSSYLVEPTHRRGLDTCLGRTISRVDHFYFHFHRILTTLDPTFSILASLVHDKRYSGK